MLQTSKKKTGKGTKEEHLMLIDGSGSKEVGVNFSDEDAFFTFWFYSINLYLPRASVGKND